jgi:hypothetical protein
MHDLIPLGRALPGTLTVAEIDATMPAPLTTSAEAVKRAAPLTAIIGGQPTVSSGVSCMNPHRSPDGRK